jgi:hypothetical protein
MNFHGIPKDTIPVKPKFFNHNNDRPWPPLRPRALRAITANEPVSESRFVVLRTFLAMVKVINNE